MGWKLTGNRATRSTPAALPDGVVAFAIGDMHGEADLVCALTDKIVEMAKATAGEVWLVGLGDYVDRGPETPMVIDRLLALEAEPALNTCFLRGNHEEVLLAFLEGGKWGPSWRRFGGEETLLAYGVKPPASDWLEDWEAVRQALAAAMPAEHLGFLHRLVVSFELGDYFFAHAGAKPGRALDRQTPGDLLWIRDPFLNDRRLFDKVVVHGHSPLAEVHADQRRIGMDTGAYLTGVLSAVRLEGQGRTLLQAARRAEAVEVREAPLADD